MPRQPRLPLLVVAALLVAGVASAAAPVTRPARAIAHDGVTVDFPAVTYQPPASTDGKPAVVAARMASEALGTKVDPVRDLVAVTSHRVVLRDPTDPGKLLKIYRPDQYDADHVAKYLQRDLGFEAFLRGLGLRVATIDRNPALLRYGVLRVERIDGQGLDDLYPNGYPAGANPRVDAMLAKIAKVDRPLIGITSRQSGLFFTNTVDCRDEIPLGVDVGHCRGNIFIERTTGEPVLVDW